MQTALLSLAFIVGLGCLAYGAWLAWEPAGFLTVGTLLVTVPMLYVRGERKNGSS